VTIRRGVLLLTENSLKILGGSAPKPPTAGTVPPSFELPIQSAPRPSLTAPTSPLNAPSSTFNAPPIQPYQQVQLIRPLFPPKFPPPTSSSRADANQESKFETRPKTSVDQTSTRVIDLIGSPDELKSTTQNGFHSVVELADPFTYDLCEIDESQTNRSYEIPKQHQLDSRIQIQDPLQPGKGAHLPTDNQLDQERPQVSEETLSAPSQNSSISPFRISPNDTSTYTKTSLMFQDLSDSPKVQQRRRLFISDILRNSPSMTTYYIEGTTVGIEAMKVEEDPISKQLRFLVIVQFEEIENSSFSVRIDPNLCQILLKLAANDYRIMLDKLSTKVEKRQFKLNLCSKLGVLCGKFTFQINHSVGLPYVGTILSFLTE
jgi:hypothetical protein